MENDFSDKQYARFPYHEIIQDSCNRDGEKKEITIGEKIYNKLKDEYNKASGDDNTLVVYTMDAFLNKEQAGQCIVNFYRNITARMNQEKCFRGERVGVLVQENVIPENEKDAKEHIDILYNIGEIIQIGTNQATYLAAEEKINSDDDFSDLERRQEEELEELSEMQRGNIERFVKEHSKNRAMRIHPNNPVFVDRMKNLLHKDILKQGQMEEGQIDNCCNLKSFCLYHVMLRTLRYTNEIVVDISDNCLQSLFWLGAAHGSDIYAITVIHEKTDMEKDNTEKDNTGRFDMDQDKKLQETDKNEKRNVFDVSGLWAAILRKNDTKGFYEQLVSAQSGIERHSKLMLKNIRYYKETMKGLLFLGSALSIDKLEEEFTKLYKQKSRNEKEKMESYYRDRFWKPLLNYNQLCIYLSQMNEKGRDDAEPRLCMSKWDYDAVAIFSNYLSKRKMIGEYLLVSLPSGKPREKLEPDPYKINFVCIGSDVYPLGQSLPEYINGKITDSSFQSRTIRGTNVIHQKWTVPERKNDLVDGRECRNFKGFQCIGNEGLGILTHHPKTKTCIDCSYLEKNIGKQEKAEDKIFYSSNALLGEECCLTKNGTHCEMAQLILWREESSNTHDRDYFWVDIAGSSGPATEALAGIFVTMEQRKFMKEKKDGHLLYDLQEVVRKKVMEVFLAKLWEHMKAAGLKFWDVNGREVEPDDEKQVGKYFALVEHAVSSYLRTVLYRYFFPLLSEKDVDRICNGMYTFLNSMLAARISPFALKYHSGRDRVYSSFVADGSIQWIVNEIPKVLRLVLKSFRGLEAFYNVKVHHRLEENDKDEDTRGVAGIERLQEDFSSVNCFFI